MLKVYLKVIFMSSSFPSFPHTLSLGYSEIITYGIISHDTFYTSYHYRPPSLKLRRDSALFFVMQGIYMSTLFVLVYLTSGRINRSARARIIPANFGFFRKS